MNRLVITDERLAPLGDFYGIFFEDINHAADGGLYAELVRNRSFEFSPIDNPSYSGLTAWAEHQPEGTTVSLSVSDKQPMFKENPHYLVMEVKTEGAAAGVKNEGFNSGIPLRKGAAYKLTVCAAASEGTIVTVSLTGADGSVYDSAELTLGEEWREYSAQLKAGRDDFSARLLISMNRSGKARFAYVSLFPEETYKNRENGLRKDIAGYLEALKPKFVRFPGGCLVHDGSLNKDDRDANYRWKNTIGDVKRRPSRRNNWRYNQTLGLGYYEYFLFCEDIGAKPLPVLAAGYNPHSRQGVPLDEMDEWIDDALDLIEFANGAADSEWGAVRARLGHPEPFGLEYLAIGNEEVGQGFFDRYEVIHKAVREKYPEIKLINSAGPFCHGGEYDRGWSSARKNGSDIIDEHYYMTPEWFIANCHRYDDFSADDPKVFLGEYASWDNKYYNAVAEAAYMTGLENNAHAVALVCYAPLLCNAQYTDWEPDMIWFDNHRVYGSANYYVQKMFMTALPTHLLRVEKWGFDKKRVFDEPVIGGIIKLAADRCGAEFSNIRITDRKTGKTEKVPDISARSDVFELGRISSESYSVELDAVRLYGDLGFKLTFGYKDEGHKIVWSVGGWQNQDCILDKFEKHGACLTQSRFSVETGVKYSLRLDIDGRRIRTYINGVKMNDVTDKRRVNEELYYTAGVDDESGDVILKAVNVNDTAVTGEICVPYFENTECFVTELSGFKAEDKNSFEEPERIKPREYTMKMNGGSIEYGFKPLSVTVFRIKNRK